MHITHDTAQIAITAFWFCIFAGIFGALEMSIRAASKRERLNRALRNSEEIR